MGRNENVACFEDTKRCYMTDPILSAAIERSEQHQQLILERDDYHAELPIYAESARIIVNQKRSFEAAQAYIGQKVCVLNFASAKNPGGGVAWGSTAQEESLCRVSTLYPCLTDRSIWAPFYGAHRRQRGQRYNDDCIYTPDVVVFKSDTRKPWLLPKHEWHKVNVITCAAPNLRTDREDHVPVSDEELYMIHAKRLRRILDIAATNGNEVMILGAYGCGAFKNPPEVVARAMKEVVEEYRHHFCTIEFAVYCSGRDRTNYEVFRNVIGGNHG